MNEKQTRKKYCREQAEDMTKDLVKSKFVILDPVGQEVFRVLLAAKFEIVYIQGEKFAIKATLDKLKGALNHD